MLIRLKFDEHRMSEKTRYFTFEILQKFQLIHHERQHIRKAFRKLIIMISDNFYLLHLRQ